VATGGASEKKEVTMTPYIEMGNEGVTWIRGVLAWWFPWSRGVLAAW